VQVEIMGSVGFLPISCFQTHEIQLHSACNKHRVVKNTCKLFAALSLFSVHYGFSLLYLHFMCLRLLEIYYTC